MTVICVKFKYFDRRAGTTANLVKWLANFQTNFHVANLNFAKANNEKKSYETKQRQFNLGENSTFNTTSVLKVP